MQQMRQYNVLANVSQGVNIINNRLLTALCRTKLKIKACYFIYFNADDQSKNVEANWE